MKAPRLPSLFKLGQYNRNKKFQYQPRTFDERKERLEKRQKEIEEELLIEKSRGSDYESHLRERISESWHRKDSRRQQRNSGSRVLLILAALLIVSYFVLKKMGLLL
jgi:hypothetical protein